MTPEKPARDARKPRKIVAHNSLDFEVWKDDGGYEYVQWELRPGTCTFGYLHLSEAVKLRAMLDYVIWQHDHRVPGRKGKK